MRSDTAIPSVSRTAGGSDADSLVKKHPVSPSRRHVGGIVSERVVVRKLSQCSLGQ